MAATGEQRLGLIQELGRIQRDFMARSLGPLPESFPGAPSRGGSRAINPVLPVLATPVTRDLLDRLADDENVVAVMPNQRVRWIRPKYIRHEHVSDEEKADGLTWGLKKLRIPELWTEAGTRGGGVKVAVLDTGVQSRHPALHKRVDEFAIFDPQGTRITANPPFDCGRHGTHVCGTIAGGRSADGVQIGVAPDCDLLVGGVLVGDATLFTLIAGINWAVNLNASVINMSFGFDFFEPQFTTVFDELLKLNVIPVVAIGNENHGNSSSPGNTPGSLAVGALEMITPTSYAVAPFSSGASLEFIDDTRRVVTKPDLVAPGVGIYSCIPPEQRPRGRFEYMYMDGTSMAAPHVAGVAAVLKSAHPEATATEIIKALLDTASHPKGDRRPDNRWGHGIIDPIAAFHALKRG